MNVESPVTLPCSALEENLVLINPGWGAACSTPASHCWASLPLPLPVHPHTLATRCRRRGDQRLLEGGVGRGGPAATGRGKASSPGAAALRGVLSWGYYFRRLGKDFYHYFRSLAVFPDAKERECSPHWLFSPMLESLPRHNLLPLTSSLQTRDSPPGPFCN